MIKHLLLIANISLLISCGNQSDSNPTGPKAAEQSEKEVADLNGTWELYKRNDTLFSLAAAYPSVEVGQPTITLSTEESQISGYTGCNAFGAKAKFTQKTIMVNDTIEAHQQLCVGKWETEFFDALRNIESYRFEQEDLELIFRNNNSMTFRRDKDE